MSKNLFVIDESDDDTKDIIEPVEISKRKASYVLTEKRKSALTKAREVRQANALIRKANKEAFKKQLKAAENYRPPVENTNEINELKDMLKKLLLEKEQKVKEEPEPKQEKQELEIKIVREKKEKKKPVKKVKVVEVTDTDATESEIELVKKPKRVRATRKIEPEPESEGYEEYKSYSPPPPRRTNFVSSFF